MKATGKARVLNGEGHPVPANSQQRSNTMANTKDNQKGKGGGGSKGGGSKGGGSKGGGSKGGNRGGSKGGGGNQQGGNRGGSKGGGSKGGNRGGSKGGGGNQHNGKGGGRPPAAKPNGLQAGLGQIVRGAKRVGVGLVGGIGAGAAGRVTHNAARHFFPNFAPLDWRLSRPVITAGYAWWLVPMVFGWLGASAATRDDAKLGGLLTAGLDGVNQFIGDPEEAIARRFRFGADEDTRQVATTERTALPPATQQVINEASKAGAQAGAVAALGALGLRDESDDDDVLDSVDGSDDYEYEE